MIVHNKGNSIGYDTVNRCFSRVRTVENTSYKTMFNICIDKILEGVEIEKYKIIKFRKSGTQKVMEKNLTLDQAKRYCSRPDTRGKNWFCGFTQQ